ncbi:protein rolling stone-like isoform X2 [Gigantopelta aegis]|nr:protein rolling stone-like isoform X2 [Gigantopelta aegis]
MGRSCEGCLKEEFSPRNFLLNHKNPLTFIQFQCGKPRLYAAWRLFGVCVCATLVGVSLHLSQYFATSAANRWKWPIFLTNWSLVVLLVSAVWDLAVTFHTQCNRKDVLTGDCHLMPWYLKADWVIHNIAGPAAFSISLMYWTLLYTPGQSFEGFRILSFLSHGINSIYAFINIIVSGIPTRILHFYQPLIYAITYVIFTVVYHAAGGANDKDEPYIYLPLDWSAPNKAGPVALGAIVLGLAMHLFVYFIAFLRELVASKRCGAKLTSTSDDGNE